MKNWTVNRNSALVRWAYLFDSDVPRQTSLCAIFWRSVLIVPAALALIVGAIAGVATLVFLYLRLWFRIPKVAGLISLAVFFAGTFYSVTSWLAGGGDRKITRAVGNYWDNSILVQGALATKQRFCPIITIVRDNA